MMTSRLGSIDRDFAPVSDAVAPIPYRVQRGGEDERTGGREDAG